MALARVYAKVLVDEHSWPQLIYNLKIKYKSNLPIVEERTSSSISGNVIYLEMGLRFPFINSCMVGQETVNGCRLRAWVAIATLGTWHSAFITTSENSAKLSDTTANNSYIYLVIREVLECESFCLYLRQIKNNGQSEEGSRTPAFSSFFLSH